ncbi:MAG TPA: sorbosone dehydrogenase family protein [Bacteroidia bacterium]|nr:sorbosone dehydrogenase family protein [Bacteroidia bacterium]
MKNALFFLACFIMACHPGPSKEKKDSIAAGPGDTAKTAVQKVNLPPPYATKSALNPPDVIGWGENATPVAPNGFTVTRYAGDLDNPRWIYVLPNGDVLVAEAKKDPNKLKKVYDVVTGKNKSQRKSEYANRIILFRDTNKDGTPDHKHDFITGQNLPFGMLLLNNYFYLANTDALWRFPYRENETSIMAKGEKIADIPGGGEGHWTRSLVANAAGTKLYIGVGSESNVGEDGIEQEKNRACILEVNPDGSGLRVFAGGLRNPVGIAFYPGTNTLWAVVNERDGLGDELVPDYLTHVLENGFYGWPYAYYGQNPDPRLTGKEQRPELVKRTIVPDVSLGAHTAALGLAFYDKNKFPEKYRGGAFIGLHGSWNRSALAGYKVIYVPFKNGKPFGVPEDFLTGFISDASKSQAYGRPVGVAVLPDGSLLVADDAGNTIWRVHYTK